jgi:hypothetical protein
MKNLLLTATFVLASFSSFAAKADVKSNNAVTPVKNTIEVVKTLNTDERAPATCSVSISIVFVSFSYSWEC